MNRLSLVVLLGLTLFAVAFNDVSVSAEVVPTESECRPYIEKAIHELKTGEKEEDGSDEQILATEAELEPEPEKIVESEEDELTPLSKEEDDEEIVDEDLMRTETVEVDSNEIVVEEDTKSVEEETIDDDEDDAEDDDSPVSEQEELSEEATPESIPEESVEVEIEPDNDEEDEQSQELEAEAETTSAEEVVSEDQADDDEDDDSVGIEEEAQPESTEELESDITEKEDEEPSVEEKVEEEEISIEAPDEEEEVKTRARRNVEDDDDEDDVKPTESEERVVDIDDDDNDDGDKGDDDDDEDKEDNEDEEDDDEEEKTEEAVDETKEVESDDEVKVSEEESEGGEEEEDDEEAATDSGEDAEAETDGGDGDEDDDDVGDGDDDDDDEEEEDEDTTPEDELLWEGEIPENLRDRKHINELLHLDDQYEEREKASDRVTGSILKDIKKIYEGAIKPLETLYKYRDLSNRHFGDPEIFSKPLVVFMGPWSGGKSSTINYLTGNEYTQYSLRTGAEPSPAYFNILMWGNRTEILDGTQLAADYTFSGLQKFGQGLEDRLRGLKLPSKLLEKVNIVEIPGILEVRKQVQRLFPFNDACQWFIDRADMIVLMYDPAKLDAGPETEAILDQLKGREYQTRIILNKADTIHPEELLRVQSALIWNISPLMSSAQPPAMYTTSLWSHPYESGAPVRLLQAQERAFLRDLRTAVDKRIENRIASARRFAVRVRNHAKMVDCYLNTYYNHKTLFGNKKRISDEIIDNPQNYHIYEGLSTLTNISRYDLPDPDVYRDFFRLNPLFEFKKLSETCTYFGGCPITKLDTAIAYDLPELVGKYKKMAESAVAAVDKKYEALQKDVGKEKS